MIKKLPKAQLSNIILYTRYRNGPINAILVAYKCKSSKNRNKTFGQTTLHSNK